MLIDGNELTVSRMQLKHVPFLAQLEPDTPGSSWPIECYERELKNDAAVYLVMELDGQLVGYAGAWMLFEDMEVVNIAIAPDRRGQHLGHQLFWHLMDLGRQRGCTFCTLEVRFDNESALALYKSFGFKPVGRRKNYYQGQFDAILMRVDGLDTEPYAQLLDSLAKRKSGQTNTSANGDTKGNPAKVVVY